MQWYIITDQVMPKRDIVAQEREYIRVLIDLIRST